jgi:glycosyltransferase involved in cell wall biosynthesis
MRVAFVTDEVLPSTGADTIQFVHALSALAAMGVHVDLILPVRPGSQVDLEALRTTLAGHYGAACGFSLVPVPTQLGASVRVWTKLATGVLGSRAALGLRPDLVHTRIVAPSLAALALGRPLFFETYRPLTRQLPVTRPLFRALSRARTFGGLIVHSDVARDAFVADGVPPERVITLYNGFSSALLEVDTPMNEARARLGLPSGPLCLYAGRLSAEKGCDVLVDAARRTPEVQWVFVGNRDTPDAQALLRTSAGLANVRYTGFLTAGALDDAYRAADVLLIPPSAGPLEKAGKTVLPLKTFSYLASGRAILAGDVPDAREVLRHDVNAVLVAPDEPEVFVSALRALLADPARRERLGAQARALAATQTWDNRARRLVVFYERRLSEMQ